MGPKPKKKKIDKKCLLIHILLWLSCLTFLLDRMLTLTRRNSMQRQNQEPRNCCITDSPTPETRSSVAKDTNQLQDFWLMSPKSRKNLKDLSSKLERKMSRFPAVAQRQSWKRSSPTWMVVLP